VDSIDWAVCVNEAGELVPVVITPTKQEFYAIENTSASTYYLVSNSFAELVETRKDLVPIDVITADIASFALGANADVRRFLTDGNKRELVYSPKDFAGTFHTAVAMKNWVNQYSSETPLIVKVRGTFDVTSTIDLTGFTSPVILDGDGAVFNITANVGLQIESNITFKNITFNYDPDLTAISFFTDDIINTTDADGPATSNPTKGAIVLERTVANADNIHIKDCVFRNNETNSSELQRPPFIAFKRQRNTTLSNVSVRRCKFSDNFTAGGGREYAAAIAIVTIDTAIVEDEPAVVFNCRIEDNFCENVQGIWLTQERRRADGLQDASDLVVYDTMISGNTCGVIGFLTTAQRFDTVAFDALTRQGRQEGLIIKNNHTNAIGNFSNFPTAGLPGTRAMDVDAYDQSAIGSGSGVFAGSVSILDNDTNTILVTNVVQDLAGSPTFVRNARILIKGNRITATDTTLLDGLNPAQGFTNSTYSFATDDHAIKVGQNTDNQAEVIISDNYITVGRFTRGGTFGVQLPFFEYDGSGIVASGPCSITNNVIKGFTVNGIDVQADGTDFRIAKVTGNSIYRLLPTANTIARYIALPSSILVSGVVANNVFDDSTIDGGAYSPGVNDTINTTASKNWTITTNKNHIQTAVISSAHGRLALYSPNEDVRRVVGQDWQMEGVSVGDTWAGANPTGFGGGEAGQLGWYSYANLTTGVLIRLSWMVPLYGVIPDGASLVSVRALFDVSITTCDKAEATFYCRNLSSDQPTGIEISGVSDVAAAPAISGRPTVDKTFTPTQDFYYARPDSGAHIEAELEIDENTTDGFTYRIGPLHITFKN
jgi:hypothetical protein